MFIDTVEINCSLKAQRTHAWVNSLKRTASLGKTCPPRSGDTHARYTISLEKINNKYRAYLSPFSKFMGCIFFIGYKKIPNHRRGQVDKESIHRGDEALDCRMIIQGFDHPNQAHHEHQPGHQQNRIGIPWQPTLHCH